MENVRAFLEQVENMELSITAKGSIKQDISRKIKKDFMVALMKDLAAEANLESFDLGKEFAVTLFNREHGGIPVTINPVIKNLEFDYLEQHEDYMKKQADKVVKAKEKEIAKQKKIAKDKELRAKAAKEREEATQG